MRLNRCLRVMTLAAALGATGCGPDCDELKREAAELKGAHAGCSSGDTCEIVDLYDVAGANNCLAAFQCSAALREGADLAAFRSKARALADEFADCSECATAGCVNPAELRAECNVSAGRCELVPR